MRANFSSCVMFAVTISVSLSCQQSSGQQVQYRPEVTDTSGNPISSIAPMESFIFNLYVQDIRPDADGVFSGYADVQYDASLFATAGEVTHYEPYVNGKVSDLSTPGLMNEVGGVDGISPLGGDEFRLLSVPMTSLGDLGAGDFQTDPVEQTSIHATTVYNQNVAVPAEEIVFLSTTLTVVPEPTSICLLTTMALFAASAIRRRKSR